jgi:hypothetical protein
MLEEVKGGDSVAALNLKVADLGLAWRSVARVCLPCVTGGGGKMGVSACGCGRREWQTVERTIRPLLNRDRHGFNFMRCR